MRNSNINFLWEYMFKSRSNFAKIIYVNLKGFFKSNTNDLYNELKSVVKNLSIQLEKVIGIQTDRAQAITNMNISIVALLFNEIKNVTGREIS